MTDLTTSLPAGPVEATPAAALEAAALAAGPFAALVRRFLADQESPATFVAARRVLAAFLPPPAPEPVAEVVLAELAAARDTLVEATARLRAAPAETFAAVLRQRAPLALLEGCWLDTVSQPATQPALVVNRLVADQYELLGGGVAAHTLEARRRRVLDAHGVLLPDLVAPDFLTAAQARPLTVAVAAFHLALARLPASFLPEVVGVHCAVRALGVDADLYGVGAAADGATALLAEYLALTEQSPTGAADRARVLAAVRLAVRLETEHVEMLDAFAAWHRDLSLDAKVAMIVARHAPYAGKQHHEVVMAGVALHDVFADPAFDAAAFVRRFRASSHVRPLPGGGCRLTKAIKFGGPMFGIFDEGEAATLEAWVAAVAAGAEAGADLVPCAAGDAEAAAWHAAVAVAEPAGLRVVDAAPLDDRQLLHRLVNVERYPGVLDVARERVEEVLVRAEALFELGAAGRYTDASWFAYTPEALYERVESIYWDKLVGPYQPLRKVPSRDAVVAVQKGYALGGLIDGAWAYRIGNTGRFHRPSDRALYAIYADEMGRGDLAKNHIVLIHQVLRDLGVSIPHLRDEAYLEQTELPDASYPFATFQLSLASLPDTYYDQILGFNLGIEMFGLGELRLHEMQKLRHHGLDVSYEEVHLSIDNISAGHARQSADLVVGYLDQVGRTAGSAALDRSWREVWRGYASFALWVEPVLYRRALTATPATAVAS